MRGRCKHEDCKSWKTEEYTYPVGDDDKILKVYLCWEHAEAAGFCPMCGSFVAGSGDENYMGSSVCYECYGDIASEVDDYPEDYYDDY